MSRADEENGRALAILVAATEMNIDDELREMREIYTCDFDWIGAIAMALGGSDSYAAFARVMVLAEQASLAHLERGGSTSPPTPGVVLELLALQKQASELGASPTQWRREVCGGLSRRTSAEFAESVIQAARDYVADLRKTPEQRIDTAREGT